MAKDNTGMSPKAARNRADRTERRLGLVGVQKWDASKIQVDELDNVNRILQDVKFLCADFNGGSSSNSGVVFAAAVSAMVIRAGMVLDRQLDAAQADTLDWANQI